MNPQEDSKSYKQIFKSTALLGGAQVFNIGIGVILNKVISILLGPVGMGIAGLLTSTQQVIGSFSNVGISQSGIKVISKAHEEGDTEELGKSTYVIKRLTWIAGLLGVLVTLILSKQLSLWAFGNEDFTISFVVLSLSMLFYQLTRGNYLIINGCRKLRYYVKATLLGNFLSLFITIPLYYLYGKDAIAPVLVLLSLSTFICSYYFYKKIGIKEIKIPFSEFKVRSVDVLTIGIAISASDVFPVIASFVIRSYVSLMDGLSDVGMFAAGFTILNGYVGLVFQSMSADYFPRLYAAADNNVRAEDIFNKQMEITILLLFPLVMCLVALGKFVVLILYTEEFLPMLPMLYWGALGMIAKALNWGYGSILIPKKEAKAYFILSLVSAIIYLGVNIIMYNLWGLAGMGFAFLSSQLIDFLFVYLYVSRKYKIRLRHKNIADFLIISILITFVIIIKINFVENIILFLVLCLFVITTMFYSYYRLNRLLNIADFLKSKFRKS